MKKDLRPCAQAVIKVEMKDGNVPVNLSIRKPLALAVKGFVAANARKGRRNLSELTEGLWISYMRKQGAKMPVLLKD